ncbi:MAG TPA: lysophospholipid acyltransferase family protein [Candidatus Sulfotelmatobacter sp.]|nr:lysophospholipid acyltransferase family protein [Candidatus Sulfotelmatobacter sp.]
MIPHSALQAGGRLALYAALTLVLMPVQALFVLLGSRLGTRLPRAYHDLCRRIFGVRVVVTGTPSSRHPTLFVSNHQSYLDITVLGSLIGGSFVAKAEVARWPLFGWLARLQRTVFVDRQRASTLNQNDEMRRRLAAGDNLVLFPEGTSSDGNRTLRFKSSLLAVADTEVGGHPVTVQPVSLAYLRLDGLPIGRAFRPFFAWYGDMVLASHLWRMAGLGTMTAGVHFHPPLSIAACGSRKALARAAHEAVARGVAELLSGRTVGGETAGAGAAGDPDADDQPADADPAMAGAH